MLRQLPCSPRSLLTAASPLVLGALVSTHSASALALGPSPLPATTELHELSHDIHVRVTPEGAHLSIERSFHNPGALPAMLELPIELPCEATLDTLRLADHAAPGGWRSAAIVDPDQADAQWNAWLERPATTDAARMRNPDTALLMTRTQWSCAADISLFPVPAFGQQTLSYELFVPSDYAQGEYSVELPSFADYGLAATLQFDPQRVASGFEASIDGALLNAPLPLDASSSHELRVRASDDTHATTESASIDLAALLAANADARALLSEEELGEPATTLFHARFDAPRRLAQLPPARRVVLVLDASRSLSPSAREQAERSALAYLEALAVHVEATGQREPRVEILNFAREVAPMYHALVPLSWAIEDLDAVDLQLQNGSAVDLALADARALLSEADARDARVPEAPQGADWIVVFSDLELREAFDLQAQAHASAQGQARMHVVDIGSGGSEFAPAELAGAWTQLAMHSGGMGWGVGESASDSDSAELGAELVEPRRVWDLQLAAELQDGAREQLITSDTYIHAGERYGEQLSLPALARAVVFSGQVWGQPRAWSASSSDAVAHRLAGRIATDGGQGDASPAIRTVLAHLAGAITPYSSAYLELAGAGALSLPSTDYPLRGISSHCGWSSSCGGGRGIRCASKPHIETLEALVQGVLDSCPSARAGQFEIETTTKEIVDVHTTNACLERGSWGLDLGLTTLVGHQSFTIEFTAGRVAALAGRDIG